MLGQNSGWASFVSLHFGKVETADLWHDSPIDLAQEGFGRVSLWGSCPDSDSSFLLIQDISPADFRLDNVSGRPLVEGAFPRQKAMFEVGFCEALLLASLPCRDVISFLIHEGLAEVDFLWMCDARVFSMLISSPVDESTTTVL